MQKKEEEESEFQEMKTQQAEVQRKRKNGTKKKIIRVAAYAALALAGCNRSRDTPM